MTIYLFIYIHCTTCLWFYLVSIDQTWMPIKDTMVGYTDVWMRPPMYQSFMSMYYMVIVVGGNETGPSNVMLKFMSTANILIGNLYLAKIMGSMADYVTVISRRDNKFEEKLDVANTIMDEIKVSNVT